MGLVHEGSQVLVRAEAGVNMKVVYGVVFVILPGGENGVQIDAICAEGGYGVEVQADSFERAAEAGAAGRSAETALAARAGQAPPRGGEAVREDVVDHGVHGPVRRPGYIRAVVEGELEIVRALRGRAFEEQAAGVEQPLNAVREFKVIIESVIRAIQPRLPPVTVLSLRGEAHGRGREAHLRIGTGGIAVPERAGRYPSGCAAQAENRCVLVQAEGVFAHRSVDYGVLSHIQPFTPPAVRPETMYFCILKKISSSGMEARMLAAVKSGQERV